MSRYSKVGSPMRFALTALITGLVAACSSEDPVDIGDGNLVVDKSSLSTYAGVWRGYVEAYTFDAGTDVVRLEIDESGSGVVSIGEGEPLRAADDPTFGISAAEAFRTGLVRKPMIGLPYSLQRLRIESERIRFETVASTAFQSWCEARPAHDITLHPAPNPALGGPEYRCRPKGYALTDPAEGFPIQGFPITDEAGECILHDWDGLEFTRDEAENYTVAYCANGACTEPQACEEAACDALADALLEEHRATVPCFNVIACDYACTCDATSCRARAVDDPSLEPTPVNLVVDAVLSDDGQTLTGTIVIHTYYEDDATHTIRLTRG